MRLRLGFLESFCPRNPPRLMGITQIDYIRMLERVSKKPARSAEPVERESDLHQEILDECRSRGWIALHGSMADPTRRTIGEPDFTIIASNGRVLFVECKSRTGKYRTEQRALHLLASTLGHTVHVVRSVAEFVAIANKA